MAKLPSDDVIPSGRRLTRHQRKLLKDIREAGGFLVVDGRRAAVAQQLRTLGVIDCHLAMEQDPLRSRLAQKWGCSIKGRAALSNSERTDG